MRKLIFVCALALFFAPTFAVAERVFGCDFDADGTEDFVKSRGCKFNQELQRIVCSKLVVRLSSDNIRQNIDFSKIKSRARRGYSGFVCLARTDDSGRTDLFATNKKNVIEKVKKIRNDALANNFIGTWLIEKEGTYSYFIFNENGTFTKKRAGESLNGITHFTGTYSVNDGFLSGDFTNPGVGRGEIEGEINAGGTFLMDFIEYWHSPRKVVPCVGERQ
ncbi:MAG: lipocalin family protein [Candidatus Paceibacterota bacterium]